MRQNEVRFARVADGAARRDSLLSLGHAPSFLEKKLSLVGISHFFLTLIRLKDNEVLCGSLHIYFLRQYAKLIRIPDRMVLQKNQTVVFLVSLLVIGSAP